MSAEERHYARSVKIRKKLRSWLQQNVGESWRSMGELHRDAANYASCSMQTAARWIYQFTGPGQEYQIIEHEDTFELATRNPTLDGARLWDEAKAEQERKVG